MEISFTVFRNFRVFRVLVIVYNRFRESHNFLRERIYLRDQNDNGYPHDGRADKNPYPHDRRADKDSYPHDSNNQCIILRLQLSFAMSNVQLMLV